MWLEGSDAGFSKLVLVALVVGLAGVLQPASVLDDDGLALLGLNTGALLDKSLGNTHFDGLEMRKKKRKY